MFNVKSIQQPHAAVLYRVRRSLAELDTVGKSAGKQLKKDVITI